GRALDRGVAPERHDAGAGTADVAQEELEQRTAADGLWPVGVLSPGDGVRERGGAIAPGVGEDRLRHLEEGRPGAAGDALDHFRRVAAEVPLHDLKDGARVLERLVASRRRRSVDRRGGYCSWILM